MWLGTGLGGARRRRAKQRELVVTQCLAVLGGGAAYPGTVGVQLPRRCRGVDGEREKAKEIFASGTKATVLDDRMIETSVIVMINPETHYVL